MKCVSLTAINMYLLLWKMLYNGCRAKIFLHNHLPYISISNTYTTCCLHDTFKPSTSMPYAMTRKHWSQMFFYNIGWYRKFSMVCWEAVKLCHCSRVQDMMSNFLYAFFVIWSCNLLWRCQLGDAQGAWTPILVKKKSRAGGKRQTSKRVQNNNLEHLFNSLSRYATVRSTMISSKGSRW